LDRAKDYKELLKKEKLKSTKHRNSILDVIVKAEQPVTVETIYLKLKEQGIAISLSTVYRVLEALLGRGLVVKTSINDDSKALFEINTMEHKHHLLCVKCRKMLPVEGCPLEDYVKALEEKLGFSIKGHKLEMFGYCQSCKHKEE
jgi:Fur family ferric uptake transcriptional regulator